MLYIATRQCSTVCGTNTLSQPLNCPAKPWMGRINGVSFIPCADADKFNETDLGDLTNWSYWFAATTGTAKYLRGGFGAVGQNEIRNIDSGSCDGEEVAEIQWKLSWTQKNFDLVDFTTHEFINELIQGGYKAFNVVAHYCKPADTILPIGLCVVKMVDDTHTPDINTEHTTQLDFIWTPDRVSIPVPMKVVDISTVIPKW